MFNTRTPYTASYVLLRKDQEVAFVLRENTGWMDGYYGLPAGKVEKNESFISCAIREALEEAGVEIQKDDIRQIHTTHRHTQDSDWVDVFFETNNWRGDVENAEPHIHGEIAWFSTSNLPKNTIPSLKSALSAIDAGEMYSEYGW